jgi:hypothetical protein
VAPYKKLFLAYEEALRLTRLERELFGWMHEISTGRVAYAVIESQLGQKVSSKLLWGLYQCSLSNTRRAPDPTANTRGLNQPAQISAFQ